MKSCAQSRAVNLLQSEEKDSYAVPSVPDLQNTFGVQGAIFLIFSAFLVLGSSMSQLRTSLLTWFISS